MNLLVFKKYTKLVLPTLISLTALIIIYAEPVRAEVLNNASQAKISFTFDDGLTSSINSAAPVLAEYGYTGTNYVITNCVGMTTIPNKCPADSDMSYMTWSQIKTLRDSYGWEIGSHGVSHKEMSGLTAKKLEAEVANSKAALVAQGINPKAFATPYGDYDSKVMAAIAKYYSSHRGFADTGYNTWPYTDYLLRVQQVQYGVSVDTVRSYIDDAIANNTWLILVFHEVRDNPSVDPEDYQYSTANLSQIAAYVNQKNIKVTNISDGLVQSEASDNMVSDPVNGTSIGNGWTTDSPTNVTIDTKSNGNTPEPVTSVKVKASPAANIHIFSPTIIVNPLDTYVVKGFVNITNQTSGSIGCYVDEYDMYGNWASGQYLQTLGAWYTKDMSFVYIPTTDRVAKVKLQIIITANSGITAYIDSVRWIVTTSGPAPEPTPNPIGENLISNSSFENGIDGWITDSPSQIVLDSNGHGSHDSVRNSIKLTSNTTINSHIFSDKVEVSSGSVYSISIFVSAESLTSGIGFYMDEYDASGNWISGKYLYTKQSSDDEQVILSYTPTSANVVTASIQIIAIAGASNIAYIDEVRLLKI